ncbi:MAG: UvrD-helicase domain-containing protein, partial [Planctomycetota bacterium]
MASRPYIAGAPDREALLRDLNPAQQEAVTHGGGPLLIVAGAGTGKTRVLTRRVAWLVAGGLPARAVLAITFTNKAAQVLRRRLDGLPRAAGVWAGTFHAFAAWILRARGEAIGIDPDYTILDREDQRRLLRDLLKDLRIDVPEMKPPRVAEMISLLKSGGAGPRPLDLSRPDIAEA